MSTCWDCPAPPWPALGLVAIGLFTCVAAALLLSRTHQMLRAIGIAAIIVGIIWYVLVTLGIWRYGIAWMPRVRTAPTAKLLMLNRIGDIALLAGWWFASITLFVRIRRASRRAIVA